MRLAAIGQNVGIADDVVEVDIDVRPGEPEPADLDGGRFLVEDRHPTFKRVTLQVNEDVDVLGANNLGHLLVGELTDGDDLAPFFAGAVVAGGIARSRVAEQSDVEARPVVRHQHGGQQLHRRVVVPKIGRDIADADAFVPGMWHGAACFCQVRRDRAKHRAGDPVQPFIAAPGHVVVRCLRREDIHLAEFEGFLDVAIVFFDFRVVVGFAGIDEIGRAQRRVLGVRLEEIGDGVAVLQVADIGGQQFERQRLMMTIGTRRQRRLEQAEDFLLVALQEDRSDDEGDFRIRLGLLEKRQADGECLVLVSVDEIELHRFGEIVLCARAAAFSRELEGTCRLRLEAELQ
ncbi:hypothetical protein D9M68_587920 [compost metagenome]